MPIDYRAEIRRPLSLALAAAVLLGWLLVMAMWLSYSNRLQETRAEVTRLQQAEGEAREQLDQQRRTAGDLALRKQRAQGCLFLPANHAQPFNQQSPAQAIPEGLCLPGEEWNFPSAR